MGKRKRVEAPASNSSVGLSLDADGNRTDDPGKAVRGEFVEYDGQGQPRKRTWFFLDEVEIKWLPISESAFLLWVFALLLVLWLVIAFVFGLI